MANPKNYWCVHASSENQWHVKQEGSSGIIARYPTQAPAWEHTKSLARAAKGEAILQGADGKIRERESYGNDPYPPRG